MCTSNRIVLLLAVLASGLAQQVTINLRPGGPRNGFTGQVNMVKVGSNLFTINIGTEVSMVDLGSMTLTELAPAAPGKTSTGFCAGNGIIVVPSFNLGSDNVASDYSLTISTTDGRPSQFVDPVVHASRCAVWSDGTIIAWFTTSGGAGLLKIARLKPDADGVYRVEKTWVTDASGITDGLCLPSNRCYFAQAFSNGKGQISILEGDSLSTIDLPMTPGRLSLRPNGFLWVTEDPFRYDPNDPGKSAVINTATNEVGVGKSKIDELVSFPGFEAGYFYNLHPGSTGLIAADVAQNEVVRSFRMDQPGVALLAISQHSGDLVAVLNQASLTLVQVPRKSLAHLTGVINGAFPYNPLANLAPGQWAALLGRGFTDLPWVASAPYPSAVSDVRVCMQVNGSSVICAPLYYVSPNQANFLVPKGLPVLSSGTLWLETLGERTNSVAIMTVAANPAAFQVNGLLAVLDTAGRQTNSLIAGNYYSVYASGCGPMLNDVPDGFPAPFAPLATTLLPVRVMINGEDSSVIFSGLAPGFVGLCQINFQVPSDVPDGSVKFMVSVDGNNSPMYSLTASHQ